MSGELFWRQLFFLFLISCVIINPHQSYQLLHSLAPTPAKLRPGEKVKRQRAGIGFENPLHRFFCFVFCFCTQFGFLQPDQGLMITCWQRLRALLKMCFQALRAQEVIYQHNTTSPLHSTSTVLRSRGLAFFFKAQGPIGVDPGT